MGYYSRKRNIRKFRNNPLVNLCYVLSLLSLVAGVFGIFAIIGHANSLSFTIIALVLAVVLFIIGKKLNARRKKQ